MQRLHAVDALRALALLGILAVNIWYFAFPENLSGTGRSAGVDPGPADQWVAFAATALFEGKSYVVFSFLFGLSFVLQWGSAHRSGASEVTRSVRRFIGLIILGLLHGIFLFVGDILLAYALLGFALLGLRRIGARAALTLAAALWLIVALAILALASLTLMLASSGMMDPAALDAAALSPSAQDVRESYTGGLGSYLAFQLSTYALIAPSTLIVQGPVAFAAFLLGLVVGRGRVLERIMTGAIPTARLLRLAIPALAVGGLLSVTAAWLTWGAPWIQHRPGQPDTGGLGMETLSGGLIFLAGPIQATGYVLVALLILRQPRSGWLVRALAPAGRMSLSNYLGQSLVLAVLFSALGAPLGLGLAGQLSASQVGLVVVGLWVVQLVLSRVWLRRFGRGPVEVPLRAWTYAEPRRGNHPSA